MSSRLIPQGIPSITEFYFDVNGVLLEKQGTSKFKAQANYSNMIIVYMEDGNTNQEINLINFTPKNNNRVYTSHWMYLAYAGIKEYIIDGEANPRVFSAYYITVPNLVLQNNKVDALIENDVTIVKRYGVENKGVFNTLQDLNNEVVPTEELMNNNGFAYVLSGSTYGFYQVGLDINTNTYKWELRDNVMNYGLEQKPMEVQTIYIQKGYANVLNLPDINTTTIQMLMQILNSLSIKVDDVLGAILNIIGLETKTTKTKSSKVGQEVSIEVDVKVSQSNKNITIEGDGLSVNVYNDSEIDDKFSNVDEKLEIIDDKIVEIEGDILGINTDITSLKDRVDDVEDLSSNNKARLDEVDLDIIRIDNKDATQDLFIDNLDTKITGLNALKLDKKPINNVALINELGKIDGRYLDVGEDFELFMIVMELPPAEDAIPNKVYLVPKVSLLDEEVYDTFTEYFVFNGKWETLGSVGISLEDYYTKDEMATILISYAKLTDLTAMETTIKAWVDSNYVLKESGKGLSTNDYTNTDKQSVEKIPTIEQDILDLESDKVDLNEMAYFDYAGSVYGSKYDLLPSAWEHSLTVDTVEISVDSSYESQRGKAQYPNGEIEGVIIPNSVSTIGSYAFYDWAANNQPLIIPNSVTSIGSSAFANWEANNHPLVIPNRVASIGYRAFANWSSVPYVEIRSITPPALALSNAFDNQNDAPIYVPDASVDDYKTATNWIHLADRIFPVSDKDTKLDDYYNKDEVDSVVDNLEIDGGFL